MLILGIDDFNYVTNNNSYIFYVIPKNSTHFLNLIMHFFIWLNTINLYKYYIYLLELVHTF